MRTSDTAITLRAMPRWYLTLFTSDALERFGFYGLQAILVLYASAPVSRGGLGLPVTDAATLFGAWIGFMFMLSIFGGWLGDRLLGNRRALVVGCLVGVAGYLCLAVPAGWAAAVGLPLVAVGSAVYKPNHQAMINLMFGGSRGREAGISLMYIATQVSALAAPLLVGYLGERVSWSLAFLVAALVMLTTAIQLRLGAGQFGEVGHRPVRSLTAGERTTVARRIGLAVAVVVAAVLALGLAGLLSVSMAIGLVGVFSVILPIVCYIVVYRNPGLGALDRRRLRAFLAVFLGSTLFWMIIAHAASLLNLFARDHVDRLVLGMEIPASWLQAATPLFILLLAPLIAVVLPALGGRNHVPVKLAIGLILVGAGFLIMSLATVLASSGEKVSPLWLVIVYLTHACGEVIVAAVIISAAAEVLPPGFMGRTLGLMWLFAGLGGGLGSGVVRLAEVIPEPLYYLGLGGVAAVCGLAFALGRRPLANGLTAGLHTPAPHASGDAVKEGSR
ncbi:proton-dependent oligopeptide transporter, POT family [Nonomuraea pusilla]|uniref:Proton-dependent oligopeptide transporter, POT family n=2 Tax=Nonomuraea pusilla TaxID=46177 RepID=A0A1H7JKW3_9ACTN|nr:proton-dependent oligopeptide transporter, POT family [Nonomuraea pusilla]